MSLSRLACITTSVAAYACFPLLPVLGDEPRLGWIATSAFIFAFALTWMSMVAIRRSRSNQRRNAIALFFLPRVAAAHRATAGIAVLILATPLAEELFFRGVLSSFTHPAISVVAFAVIHDGRVMKLLAAGFGAFMEICVLATGSLQLAIAIHTAVNAAAFLYLRIRVRLIETEDEIRMLL